VGSRRRRNLSPLEPLCTKLHPDSYLSLDSSKAFLAKRPTGGTVNSLTIPLRHRAPAHDPRVANRLPAPSSPRWQHPNPISKPSYRRGPQTRLPQRLFSNALTALPAGRYPHPAGSPPQLRRSTTCHNQFSYALNPADTTCAYKNKTYPPPSRNTSPETPNPTPTA